MEHVKIVAQANIKHNLRLARRAIEFDGESGQLEHQGQAHSAVRLDTNGRRLTFLNEDVRPTASQ